MALLTIVRSFLCLALSLTLGALASAQEQEKTLYERIMKPNTNKVFDLQQGSSYSGRQAFRTDKARVKDFYFTQKQSPKGYATTGFNGSKGTWFGDFHFSTKEARAKGKHEIPNATKKADTKTMPVTDARERGKSMAVASFEKGQRSYLGPEAERLHLALPHDRPVGWTGDLKPMTIDDVRTLLNKNK
ncbi:MAG TPA: hypothetical protein VFV83_04925 [Chthoniobacteraceae bacterium]|nr:hypothetical protein [Chthoniobacteraceae bacterium]